MQIRRNAARAALATLFAFIAPSAFAQDVSLVGGAPAVQSFDSLAASGTGTALPDGWYFAADTKTSTGFDLQTDLKQHRAYFRIPALAPLAWAALAEQGFNPFTGTKALPR